MKNQLNELQKINQTTQTCPNQQHENNTNTNKNNHTDNEEKKEHKKRDEEKANSENKENKENDETININDQNENIIINLKIKKLLQKFKNETEISKKLHLTPLIEAGLDNIGINDLFHQKRSFHQLIALLFVIMKEIDFHVNNIFGINLQLDIDKIWICPKYSCKSTNPVNVKRCKTCNQQKPKNEKLMTSILKKIWHINHQAMFNEKPIKHLIVLLFNLFNDNRNQISMINKKQTTKSKIIEALNLDKPTTNISNNNPSQQKEQKEKEKETWEQYLTWNRINVSKSARKSNDSLISLLSTAITGESKFSWYLRLDIAATMWEFKPLMCEVMNINPFDLIVHIIQLIQNKTKTTQAHVIAFAIKYNTNVIIKKYLHTSNSIENLCDTTKLIKYAIDNKWIPIDNNSDNNPANTGKILQCYSCKQI